ncbi:hypothetical protein B0J13DRAFT_404246, partial [Dactylonectria estremocensis]
MDPFVYLARHRIAVCKECRFACVSDEVATHLRIRHSHMTPAERRKVIQEVEKLPSILRNQAELVNFQFPPATAHPIPLLSPPQPDGIKCHICSHIVRQEKKMQAHCRQRHGWCNPKSQGRPLKQDSSRPPPRLPWTTGVWCQRFFPSRAASGWFEVRRPSTTTQGVNSPSAHNTQNTHGIAGISGGKMARVPPETRTHVQQVLAREKDRLGAERQLRVCAKGFGEDSFANVSVWLQRTQWPRVYKDVRRDILLAMTQLPARKVDSIPRQDRILGQGLCEGDPNIISPSADEDKIRCFLGAIDIMLDRCEETAQHTSRVLLCWLVSSKLQTYRPRPFPLAIEENTRRRYRTLWKRFITFIIRAYRMPAALREDEVRVQLRPELMRQLRCLWEHDAWESIQVAQGQWPK